MENKSDPADEKKFLHDLATPMTIIRLQTKRLLKMNSEKPHQEVETKLLEKILEALEKMEELHANHKSALAEKQAA